jgi:RNA polymerase sigma factor (sigma-70 family)
MGSLLSERFDIELLLSARAKDVDSFAEIYDRHALAVLKFAWGYLGNRYAAEDILQDTFATAWEKRSRATIVDESLLPWLLTICRNHLRNHTRKIGRRREYPLRELLDIVPDKHSSGEDELAWMNGELAKLSVTDQLVCQLCLVDGLTYREAAEALDTTAGAVGKRLERARARLREGLVGND